jgi:hypothetical protein
MKYRLTLKSRNKKTGPIPVSTTSADSCPPSCPFMDNGCYAKGGPLAIVWQQVDDIGTDLATFCDTVASAIAKANRDGFTINLSGNNLDHADALADLGIAPVVTVLPSDGTSTTTPKGRKVVQCPATSRDDVSCKTCQLCQRQRDVIVGFPAHGVAHRKASAVAA